MPPPRLLLAPGQRRRIRELAAAAWPVEVCGLLEGENGTGRVHVTAVHYLANVEAEPARGYTIDPEDFLRLEHAARARGRTVVGVWHSHPHGDATPSERDHRHAWPGWSYLIAGVTNGGMTSVECWRLVGEAFTAQPLIIFPEHR